MTEHRRLVLYFFRTLIAQGEPTGRWLSFLRHHRPAGAEVAWEVDLLDLVEPDIVHLQWVAKIVHIVPIGFGRVDRVLAEHWVVERRWDWEDPTEAEAALGREEVVVAGHNRKGDIVVHRVAREVGLVVAENLAIMEAPIPAVGTQVEAT